MAKQIEYCKGRPVLEASTSNELFKAVEKFKLKNPNVPLEAPYVVRVKRAKITWEAFVGCNSLKSVIISDSVEEIGQQAFQDCECLTSVEIPESVEVIGLGAFLYCSSLIKITLPKYMREIGAIAFKGCTGLTSIVIPESVMEIKSEAFKGCTGLKEIHISDPKLLKNASVKSGVNVITD